MKEIDCLLVGHYALDVGKQIQLAEMAFGKNSSYYYDALEKTFVTYQGRKYTSSQIYNLFYANGNGDLSIDHVTFEHSFNTAIGNLGTYLLRKGFSIDFVNTFNAGRKTLPALLLENKVWTVAIPTTFYVSGFPIARIVSFVRKYNQSAKVIVGGPFIKNLVSSLRGDETELGKILDKLGADYYVYNTQGEETLSSLVRAIRNAEPAKNVPNVYYKEDGHYTYTFAKTEHNSFHQTATDWTWFEDSIPELVNVRTTKSCPYDCAFCGLPVAGGKWQQLPICELEMELKSLTNARRRPGIFFIDETLNFPQRRFKEILRMMVRNNLGFKWEAEMRCDALDREAVELMAKSGCQLVHLGIESGNQQVLSNMSKRVCLEDYYRAMELLHEYDILSCALILVGFPGETHESFQDTVDFIEKYKPAFFRVHRWFYDHETPVHQKREEYKLTGGGYNWTHYTMNSATAHELATHMSLSIRNSIHTDDYTMAFYLLNKGYPKQKVLSFLRLFDYAIKEKCKPHSCERTIETFVDQMKTALN